MTGFPLDEALLQRAAAALSDVDVHWLLGAAGSGKSTVGRILEDRYGAYVLDMDARVYGSWHGRFDRERHPANAAWAAASSSLGFLLGMDWPAYDGFQRAAFAEYLDLLGEELAGRRRVVLDGGVYHPSLAARVSSPDRIIVLVRPEGTAAEVWETEPERAAMRGFMDALPDPARAWGRFLSFDEAIARTLVGEGRAVGAQLVERSVGEAPQETAHQVAEAWGLSLS